MPEPRVSELQALLADLPGDAPLSAVVSTAEPYLAVAAQRAGLQAVLLKTDAALRAWAQWAHLVSKKAEVARAERE